MKRKRETYSGIRSNDSKIDVIFVFNSLWHMIFNFFSHLLKHILVLKKNCQ